MVLISDESLVFFRTRPIVLISFLAASEVNKNVVNRYEIQKIVFLGVYSASISDIIIEKLKFEYYHKGPYTKIIQRSVDSLILLRLLKINSSKIKRGKINENYSLTKKGSEFANNQVAHGHHYSKIYSSILGICHSMELIGWNFLISVTYQLPELIGKKYDYINFSKYILEGTATIQVLYTRLSDLFKGSEKFDDDLFFSVSLNLIEYLFSSLQLTTKSVKPIRLSLE